MTVADEGGSKIAFVIQRFGPEVIGGAEVLALELARRLRESWRIEVLTSCAREYRDWANEYPAGETQWGGVVVRRFPVPFRRSPRWFPRLSAVAYRLDRLGVFPKPAQRLWALAQGPVVPGLLRYIREHHAEFDVFVFFTYLYYPTLYGLPLVARKSVLVPTCHDEPPAYFSGHREVLGRAAHRLYLSQAEADLVSRLIGERAEPSEVAGFAVDVPETRGDSPPGDFFLYVGRIERGKNCEELFDFSRRAGLRLVAIGPAQIPVPDFVTHLGVVDDAEKTRVLKQCRALIIPSKMESLSIVALEAWSQGKPLIVPAGSAVLADLVRASEGGYCYGDFSDFSRIVSEIDPGVGEKGRRWVQEHCCWEKILPIYQKALERVRDAGPTRE
ncbi:MAG: glycosyltransferase family 4 protein [Acidobacteriota bacterium]